MQSVQCNYEVQLYFTSIFYVENYFYENYTCVCVSDGPCVRTRVCVACVVCACVCVPVRVQNVTELRAFQTVLIYLIDTNHLVMTKCLSIKNHHH